MDLMLFPYKVLGSLKNSQPTEKVPLSKHIRQNLLARTSELPGQAPEKRPAPKKPLSTKTDEQLVKRVARKLQDGCVSGAIRELTSEDSVVSPSDEVMDSLLSKHPANAPILAQAPDTGKFLPSITSDELRTAIDAFPNGSAGGLDGLRPQHLKELCKLQGDESSALLLALASVGDLMLRGDVPPSVCPIIYGANLCAFRKKDGGIRPIAVGMTLRRLVARIVSGRSSFLSAKLNPIQLGFATKGGAEAAVHAVRIFVEESLQSGKPQALLKLDVKNAFNSLCRNTILRIAERDIPAYYPFIWQCYSKPSFLMCGDRLILSQRGVQQGDPLGPLLYCLSTVDFHRDLSSKMAVCYLDDDVLGGDVDAVLADLLVIKRGAQDHGLELNIQKCELAIFGGSESDKETSRRRFLDAFPDLSLPDPKALVYLGSPLTNEATPVAMDAIKAKVNRLSQRLEILPKHQALFLLKNCLGPVKLLYSMRTSRAYRFVASLQDFDEVTRDSLTTICNVDVSGPTWSQASLPVQQGGLGIRRAEDLALPAFLASIHSVLALVAKIIPFNTESYLDSTKEKWQAIAECPFPAAAALGSQKAWDSPLFSKKFQEILSETASDPQNTARLRAVSCKESGAWLRALPSASIGNLLDDNSVRIAVALRLGAPVLSPHQCRCLAAVDSRGYHSLSCKFSAGRLPRHAGINAIVKRALNSAGFPSLLEPTGISRADGKRPDGVTLIPWSRGKCLCWDATVVCTLALSHLPATISQAGAAAAAAEARKAQKYQALAPSYLFCPLGFETFGPWGPEAKSFVSHIGALLRSSSGEPRAADFLRQRVSLEIQRGNAISVLGTAPASTDLEDFLDAPRPKRDRRGCITFQR